MRPASLLACLILACLRQRSTDATLASVVRCPGDDPHAQRVSCPRSELTTLRYFRLTDCELATGLRFGQKGTLSHKKCIAPARGILRVRDKLRCLGLRGAGGLPRKGAGDYYDDTDDEDEDGCADADRYDTFRRPTASTIADGRSEVPFVGRGAVAAHLSPAARLFLADQEDGEEEKDEEMGKGHGDTEDARAGGQDDTEETGHCNQDTDASTGQAGLNTHVQSTSLHGLPTTGMEHGHSVAEACSLSRDTNRQSPDSDNFGDDALVRQLEDELESVVGVHEAIGRVAGPASNNGSRAGYGAGLQATAASAVCQSIPTMTPEADADVASAGGDTTEMQSQPKSKSGHEPEAGKEAGVKHPHTSAGRCSQARHAQAPEAPGPKREASTSARQSTQGLALKIQRWVVVSLPWLRLPAHSNHALAAADALAISGVRQPVRQAMSKRSSLYLVWLLTRPAAGGARPTRVRK